MQCNNLDKSFFGENAKENYSNLDLGNCLDCYRSVAIWCQAISSFGVYVFANNGDVYPWGRPVL
jgi:hypothetical protein